jgi:hypothetical protein
MKTGPDKERRYRGAEIAVVATKQWKVDSAPNIYGLLLNA